MLFDDIWRRPGLLPRDRSLVAVAALTALYRSNELPFHIGNALKNGVMLDGIAIQQEPPKRLPFFARLLVEETLRFSSSGGRSRAEKWCQKRTGDLCLSY